MVKTKKRNSIGKKKVIVVDDLDRYESDDFDDETMISIPDANISRNRVVNKAAKEKVYDPLEVALVGIRRIMSIVNSEEFDGLPMHAIETQSTIAEKYWKSFFDANTQAYAAPMSAEAAKKRMEACKQMQDEYTELLTALNKRKAELAEKTKLDETQHSMGELKIRKVEIEKFAGDSQKWTEFKSMFEAFFHKSTKMDDAAKFTYLVSYLVENSEAYNVVSGMSRIGENYNAAWKLLCTTYDNERKIVNDIVVSFIDMPAIVAPKRDELVRLINTTSNLVQALPKFKIEVQHWDPILVPILARKLDAESLRLWSLERPQREISKLQPLLDFIRKRADGMDVEFSVHLDRQPVPASNQPGGPLRLNNGHCDDSQPIQSSFQHKGNNNNYKHAPAEVKKRNRCPNCSQHHRLYACPPFLKLNVELREQKAKSLAVCLKCLRPGHTADRCTMRNCSCGGAHNRLLCRKELGNALNVVATPTEFDVPEGALLATMRVIATDRHGNSVTIRAVCDLGSHFNIISNDLAQRLRLPKKRSAGPMSALGETEVMSEGMVDLQISPAENGTSTGEWIRARTLSKITSQLPLEKLNVGKWTHLHGLPLADTSFHIPDTVDALLGAAFYSRILQDGVKKLDEVSPVAQRTSFGWIVFGTIPAAIQSTTVLIATENQCDEEIAQNLKMLWSIDSVDEKHLRTPEEQQCEEIFTNNVQRSPSGRYIVRMPIAPDAPKLGQSLKAAMARQFQNERRFRKQPELRLQYVDFMREYLSLGHMEEVPSDELNTARDTYYIPHHSARTAKFRVVFDGSVKSSNGYSLNDIQLNGERLQLDLPDIIARFRMHRIALIMDITKMYRQVLLPVDQRDLQRIVWRESESDQMKHYRLKTQTYGLKSAAHCCIRTLIQCAKDHEQQYPKAAETVLTSFYVDDGITGADTQSEAEQLYRELTEMLGSCGFQLAKWASNDWYMSSIFGSFELHAVDLDLEKENSVLGMKWNVVADCFHFKIREAVNSSAATKRAIVANIARIYDPNGFISPVIVAGKILIQDIWKSACLWDQDVPNDIKEKWSKLSNSLQHVESIEIPRWIGLTKGASIQIHGFCDGSLKAYGVAFYARVEHNGQVKCHLVASKTKVTPIKGMTVPRIELCGALLMAKMFKSICKTHNASETDAILWTDSSIVVHWLSKCPAAMKTFVGNRIAEIQEETASAQWKHVRTHDNPADLCSKGITADGLIGNKLWWHGPQWLALPQSEWPETAFTSTKSVEEATQSEARPAQVLLTSAPPSFEVVPQIENKNGLLLHQFSTMQKLVRCTAYVFRFINNCRRSTKEKSRSITQEEYLYAQQFWIKNHQLAYFADEMAMLIKRSKKPNRLSSLTPFVDAHGIMRVGGRIKRSQMSYEMTHPMILAEQCDFTTLLIREAHKNTLHGGTQLCIQYIRQRFWVIRIRNAVKKVISKCISCFRQRKQVAEQLMGDLPAARVTPGFPFETTGLDYFGPVTLKEKVRAKTTYKAYVALFVCMKTKAVHMEIVCDQTTDAFVAAFNRFVSRRGSVREMFSDNATTFHGAANEIKEIFTQWQKVHQGSLLNQVKWTFITPLSPAQGGIWERAVRSAKHHLRRVIGMQQMTHEEFHTVVVQVEACLNSRPLIALTDDATDSLALTPAHFLIGRQMIAPLQKDYTATPCNRLKRWKLLQKMIQEFWHHWHQEYVSTLIERTKNLQEHTNLKVGDIVLLRMESMPPSHWPLGKITAVFPGQDGLVRNAEVLVNGSTYRRSLSKISPLPIDDQ